MTSPSSACTSTSVRNVVGVMTGTSIDGLDAALVEITGCGLSMRARLIRHHTRPLDELAQPLRDLAGRQPMSAAALAWTAWEFGVLHAGAIAELIEDDEKIDLIAAHGQTVFHRPPLSWQVLNPAPIAAKFPCQVVTDLRQADLAAGGQGAPITPLADWVLFRERARSRAIVNLGGFCNLTFLPAGDDENTIADIRGCDVCACNHVLNTVARLALGEEFDRDGEAAAAGTVHPAARDALRDLLNRQREKHKSLGTGDEATGWVRQFRRQFDPADLAASAVEAVGGCIGEAVAESGVDEVIIAGGGSRNRALWDAVSNACGSKVAVSDEVGIPAGAREAMAMAVLGGLCSDGHTISLPGVTGCPEPAPIAGVWSNVHHFR